MTDKEINIAIAKACRKLRRVMTPEECAIARKEWAREEPTPNDELTYPQEWEGTIPDYCHDLNAMREAVLSMDEDNRAMWFNNLCDIVNKEKELALDAMSLFSIINATAGQRAEAFLRTVGKWKE